MSTRIHVLLPDEVLAQVDAARGDVPRNRFVLRALESALSDAQGISSNEQAGPVPVPSSEGVRPAAPTRTPGDVVTVIPEGFDRMERPAPPNRADAFRRAAKPK